VRELPAQHGVTGERFELAATLPVGPA